MSQASPFKWRHFEAEIISLCVRWYLRYPLSYRNLEEMMLERGLEVDHATIIPLGSAICTGIGREMQAVLEAHK